MSVGADCTNRVCRFEACVWCNVLAPRPAMAGIAAGDAIIA